MENLIFYKAFFVQFLGEKICLHFNVFTLNNLINSFYDFVHFLIKLSSLCFQEGKSVCTSMCSSITSCLTFLYRSFYHKDFFTAFQDSLHFYVEFYINLTSGSFNCFLL